MYIGNTIFQRLCQEISGYDFKNICSRFFSSNSARTFSHKNHFSFLLYCVINKVSSLREGITKFNAMVERLYHHGFLKLLSLSTVSEANSKRSYECYKALFHYLLANTNRSIRKRLEPIIHLLDASTITILDNRSFCSECSMSKGGVKLHVLLDYESGLPSLVRITSSKVSDISLAKSQLDFIPNHFYIMDRGYFDSNFLRKIHESGAFVVTRMKKNISYYTISEKN